MIRKKKCRKGVLASTLHPLLLNSFDLPSFDSESRKIYTKTVVHMSKGGEWQEEVDLKVDLPGGK